MHNKLQTAYDGVNDKINEYSQKADEATASTTAQVNRRTLFDLVLEEGKVRRTVTGRNPFETV